MIYDKIFVIGFNKTGTSSFYSLFKDVGLKSIHNVRVNYLNILDNYDTFSDGFHPVSKIKLYYDKYPNSLFILNTRPIRKWLISRYKHARSRNFKPCWCYPPSYELTKKWIDSREKHYKEVLEYFSDKEDKLIIVNIEKNNWENFVLKNINKNTEEDKNISIQSNKYPDEKMKENIMNKIYQIVDDTLDKEEYSGDETFLKDDSIENYSYKNNL